MTPLTRAAEALRTHQWNPTFGDTAHANHIFDAWCGICRGKVDEIVRIAAESLLDHPMLVEIMETTRCVIDDEDANRFCCGQHSECVVAALRSHVLEESK